MDVETRHAVLAVIRKMGFKEQLPTTVGKSPEAAVPLEPPELAIVQDAGECRP